MTPRTCRHCGATYVSRLSRQINCSTACSRAARAEYLAERNANRQPVERTCLGCGATFGQLMGRATHARTYCSPVCIARVQRSGLLRAEVARRVELAERRYSFGPAERRALERIVGQLGVIDRGAARCRRCAGALTIELDLERNAIEAVCLACGDRGSGLPPRLAALLDRLANPYGLATMSEVSA